MNTPLKLRAATAADQPGIIDLVNRIYGEYGDRICLERADGDLSDIELNYYGQNGEFVVLERAGEILGTHALLPLLERPACCTFRRLYLDASLRGQQWGTYLMQWALDRARTRGFQRIEFWSDTRFSAGHQFFRKLGFQTDGQKRKMTDGWEDYQEYFFFRELADLKSTIPDPQFDKAAENVDHGGTKD